MADRQRRRTGGAARAADCDGGGRGLPGRVPGVVPGLVLGLVLGGAPAIRADAEAAACADPRFRVEAADPALAAQVCAVAMDLAAGLSDCGLMQHHPVTIEIVPRPEHPIGTCLAAYDCGFERVLVLDPALFGSRIAPAEPYAALPAEVTLRALLAHELAHAFATQSASPRVLSIVDQEYVAAAMELDLMPPDWRAVYIDRAAVDAPPSEGLIDPWIYVLEPRKFAVNAWRHFRLPGNGCPLVGRIVAGEASFAPRPRQAAP